MDIKTYANSLIDQMIRIKDRHRDVLTMDETDAINEICNLVEHNLERLKDE